MTTYPHPHTIDDGAGSRLTFIRTENNGAGEKLIVENVVKPGGGPPMHTHHLQSETLTVVEGTIGYQVEGEAPKTAGPGATLTFEAGVAHRFWNAGDSDLRCTGEVVPPHNMEYFLTQIYESTRRNGGSRPAAFDGAYLMRRYRSEFAMSEIPGPVVKFVFPLQVAIGKLLGRHRRFDGAPEPVRGA